MREAIVEEIRTKKQFREKHEEGRDRQVKLQQIVSAMKNPVSAFALSVFLYGVSVAPATRYALAGIRHSDFAPLFETSDWIALLLCFVVGMMVIAVGFIDKRCSTWLIRAGREEDARLCAWLEFRCERRLFVSMLCVLFPGSFALFFVGVGLLHRRDLGRSGYLVCACFADIWSAWDSTGEKFA
ncbi:hypothetical protein [Parvibacter caecicola]|uniref:hypothetical protein n=1 Tax=Parvibacter caecicola TaxID=747645 RepID=UPI00249C7683|nr:hypothetical protein [Parvibacter caecicola]